MQCPKCAFHVSEDMRYCCNCGVFLLGDEALRESETGTLDHPLFFLQRGEVFAERYEIIEEIGRGGMGTVYKVFDQELKETVALKMIKPDIGVDAKTTERLRWEIKLARKISHRHVCSMFGFDRDGDIPYITMEHVSGEDLKRTIQRIGALSLGNTLRIARQICEGLGEAHRIGIIHRDLKSRNVMIDRDGQVKIMDFGIARYQWARKETGTGHIMGTPEYMSPEQIEGQDADVRSDIYALGIILYEMVTGRLPFVAETPWSLAVKQRTERPRDPSALGLHVPEKFSRIVLKCLEKDSNRRIQSTGILCDELVKLEDEYPTTEILIPKGQSLTSREITIRLSLNKILVPAVLALLILVSTFLIFWPFSRRESGTFGSELPVLAVMPFENHTGDSDLDYWRKALSECLITDLSQSRYIRIVSGDSLHYFLDKMGLAEVVGYTSKDLDEIATQVKAAYIVRGLYTLSGEQFRITVALKEISTGIWLGRDSVTGKQDEIFTLVDSLTRLLKIYVDLTPQEIAGDVDLNLADITRTDPEAYKYFQLGQYFENKYSAYGSAEDYVSGVELFQQAIQIKPDYAMSYWGLGNITEAHYVRTNDSGDLDLMARYYTKASDLDPSLPQAWLGLGWDSFYRQDFDKAFHLFKQARDLAPDDEYVNFHLGSFLRSLGMYEEAIDFYDRTIELNYLSMSAHRLKSACCMFMGDYQGGIRAIREAMVFEPSDFLNRLHYVRLLLMKKDLESAREELEKVEENYPENSSLKCFRACILAVQGDKAEALELIKDSEREGIYYLLTNIYAALDMKSEVLTLLEEGIESGIQVTQELMFTYPYLISNPFFLNLSRDPRFRSIIQKQKQTHREFQKEYSRYF